MYHPANLAAARLWVLVKTGIQTSLQPFDHQLSKRPPKLHRPLLGLNQQAVRYINRCLHKANHTTTLQCCKHLLHEWLHLVEKTKPRVLQTDEA